MDLKQKEIIEEVNWIKRSIKVYQNGFKISIKNENKEKEKEYKNEIIKLLNKLNKIERINKESVKNRSFS